ncbi:MAG: DUF4855 domain-containing protein [Parabacteroides sp.]|nr:DUF4855 domain-containing protein [Parabacteroides sp.]
MSTCYFKYIAITACLLLGSGTLSSQPVVKGYMSTDIHDLVLIYQGGSHRLDWTEDQFLPYVIHEDSKGNKDWFFDGFLFLEFKDGKGRCYTSRYEKLSARKQEWEWLLGRIFEEGKALSALNSCIGKQKQIQGNPGFKHRVVLSVPEAIPDQKDWGLLNGKALDFSKDADKYAACKWFIDEVEKRFRNAGYSNLELAGFYWVAEDIVTSRLQTVPLGDYVRSLNKKFYWIPYWNAMGYSDWKSLGFDVAYAQPNHFFDAQIPDQRIDNTCALAYTHNMGLEVEFDDRALAGAKNSFHKRLVAYLDKFESNNVYADAAIAYYEGGGAIIDFARSANPEDRALMDRLSLLVKSRRERMKIVSDDLDSSPWNGINNRTISVNPEGKLLISTGIADTRGKLEKTRGKFEIKLKLLSASPNDKAYIRLVPVRASGKSSLRNEEITMMAYAGSQPEMIKGGVFTRKLNEETDNKKGTSVKVSGLTGELHTLVCEWKKHEIHLSLDGILFFVYDDYLYDRNAADFKDYWPFDEPCYLEVEAISGNNNPVISIDSSSYIEY